MVLIDNERHIATGGLLLLILTLHLTNAATERLQKTKLLIKGDSDVRIRFIINDANGGGPIVSAPPPLRPQKKIINASPKKVNDHLFRAPSSPKQKKSSSTVAVAFAKHPPTFGAGPHRPHLLHHHHHHHQQQLHYQAKSVLPPAPAVNADYLLDADLKKLHRQQLHSGSKLETVLQQHQQQHEEELFNDGNGYEDGAAAVEWLAPKLVVQPDKGDHDDYRKDSVTKYQKGNKVVLLLDHKHEDVKPVVEDIEGDIQYDFRTRKHHID